MTYEEYQTTEAEIETHHRQLHARMENLKKDILHNQCPVKKGDIVEVNGYSYKGKKIEVLHVSIQPYARECFEERLRGPVIRMKGRVLKKDGTVGIAQAYREIALEECFKKEED